MIAALLSTFGILLSELVLYAAFAGIGLGVRRCLTRAPLGVEDALIAFWLGLATTVLVLMAANFVVPVHDAWLLIVLSAGAVLLWTSRRALAPVVRKAVQEPWGWYAAFGLMAFWVANMSLGPLENWDSELYHLPAILWAEQYPAVPGIANLYGPLAFNNATFLYGALLNAGPWQDRAFLLANGVLVIAVLLQAFVAARQVWCGRGDPGLGLFTVILAAPAVVIAAPSTLPSYATDVPTTLVMLAVMPLIAAELRSQGDASQRELRIGVLSALLALGVCMKLHVAAFAGPIWLLVVAHWWRDRRAAGESVRRGLSVAAVVPVLFAAVWMTRGIVQSGYALFPVPHLGLPVDWSAPLEHARAEQAFILHSGRFSAPQYGIIEGIDRLRVWVPRWWRLEVNRNPFELTLPVLLALVAGIVFMLRRGPRSTGPPALILVPILGATVAWFLAAPSPRYAMYLFWTGFAVLGPRAAFAAASVPTALRRGALIVSGALVLSPTVLVPVLIAYRTGANPLMRVFRQNVNRPPEGAWYPTVLEKPYERFVTRSGLALNVPVADLGGRCGRIPIPCTPNPAPNLVLRDPSDLRAGFRVEGPWQMRDWPYTWLPGFLEAWRRERVRGRGVNAPN